MNYYPQTYYPTMQPMQMTQPNNQQNVGINWVKGEQGAVSFIVAPNSTALLMDSECKRFYLKSADASGMPLPLRKFEFNEIIQEGSQLMPQPVAPAEIDLSQYVKRSEVEDLVKQQINALSKEAKSNGKSSVRADG